MLKKTFLTTINANYVIAMKIGKFSIPDKIKNNYKIVGDISNIENWKAKVILGNNTDADKIGTFDDVGYVGFKPSTGTLVPIARGDEHHTGYELLDELKEKGLIPKGTYYTLWTLSGPNYLHDESRVKEMIPVYKKWLELGGTNLQVSVTTIQEGKNKSFYMSFQDVVDGKAGIEHPQGTLLTFGREFVDILEELATLYKKALTVQKMRPPLKGISDVLLRLAAFISKHRLAPVSHKVKEEDIKKAANDILEGKDLDEKLKIIFGFNGLKNEMHKELKEATKDPKSWPARDLIEFFGDIKFALDEFNRISAI